MKQFKYRIISTIVNVANFDLELVIGISVVLHVTLYWLSCGMKRIASRYSQNMSEVQPSNDIYREWLAKSVGEGSITQYSEEDLLERTLLGHGGYGVVFKAKIKQSGVPVAMKTLFLNRYGCEEELYKKFVKEVATD